MNSSSTSPERTRPTRRFLREVFLLVLVSLLVLGGTFGGFLIGRHVTRDAFINKVSRQSGIANSSLLSAGIDTRNLLQVVGDKLDDPLKANALANLYSVPTGDRDALIKRLRTVAWVPPYRPDPFVGHMARPVLGREPHINMLGFRDERQSYVTKPERTVRIFITGGSTAWGSGASSQGNTISYLLEGLLNTRLSPSNSYRYEVINTAFPAWSTTQEKLLIQQRLVDMHPDVVIMLSGSNDVHWALQDRDIRWLYGYMDQNYMMLLNEMYKASGHADWTFAEPFSSRRIEGRELGQITARNVEQAAFALDRVHARLVFALAPNIVSTSKRLTKYEQQLLASQNKPFWDSSYQTLRDALAGLTAPNYRLLDLSRSFGEVGEDTEMFVDPFHFADRGNRLVAQALADQIDWQSITPNPAVLANATEALSIVEVEPIAWAAGKPFHQQADGTSMLRLVPNRLNKNLLVVFDQAILATIVGKKAITASIPVSSYLTKGEHVMYVVDGVTGERSPAVSFHSQ